MVVRESLRQGKSAAAREEAKSRFNNKERGRQVATRDQISSGASLSPLLYRLWIFSE